MAGCTFWMDLPLVNDPVEQVGAAMLDLPAAPVSSPGARERIVLYVEDNLSNIALIEHIMVHRPHVRLVAAMQGRLGLDLAREHRPDLILLDLHLPDISGEEVLHGLRQVAELKDIPVIVISADATRGRIRQTDHHGRLSITFPKPLDIKRFLELLDDCLKEKDDSKS